MERQLLVINLKFMKTKEAKSIANKREQLQREQTIRTKNTLL
jgi:hypothetical protein